MNSDNFMINIIRHQIIVIKYKKNYRIKNYLIKKLKTCTETDDFGLKPKKQTEG